MPMSFGVEKFLREENYMTSIELLKMRNMRFEEINKDEVINIGGFKVDNTKPVEERICTVLSKDKNPYFRKTTDGCVVKIGFSNNGRTFRDNFLGIFS